jgi:hypothetical protein
MTEKPIEFGGFAEDAEDAEEDGAGAETEDGDAEDAPFAAFRQDADDVDEIAAQSKGRLIKTRERQLYSRFSSERQLEEICDWEFEEGCAYHCLTAGTIDSMAFLRLILRQQPLDYLCFSTWAIASADIDEYRRLLGIGRIRRLDSYVGDLHTSSLFNVYAALRQLHKAHGGRCGILINHSKTFAGFGPKFAFAIETSANHNTNKRVENRCITVDRGLALAYKEFFDSVPLYSYKDDFPDWRPWEPPK